MAKKQVKGKRKGAGKTTGAKEKKSKRTAMTTATTKEETVTVKVHKKDPWKKVLHWSARGLGLLIILFWTSFIIMSHGFSTETLVESIIVISLIAVLLCAWRYEVAGGAIFIILGMLYMVISVARLEILAIILVATPPVAAGGLFVAEGLMRLKD